MSRTYKDRPYRIRFDKPRLEDSLSEDELYYNFSPYRWIRTEKPGIYPKVKRHYEHESHWYRNTPGWWTKVFSNRPQRRKGRMWEHEVVRLPVEDVDTIDSPPVEGPLPYYW